MSKTRQTSIDCYNKIKENGLLSKRRFEVYEAIFKNAPCTTNEAMKGHFSGSHGIGSRTSELRDLGVIYEKGTRECKVTGIVVIEWDLTDNLPDNTLLKKTKNTKPSNFKKSIKFIIDDMNRKGLMFVDQDYFNNLI